MRRAAFVATAAAAAVLPARTARAAPTGLTFDPRTTIPVVRARAFGREVIFAIDTGSAISVLSPPIADSLNLTAQTLPGVFLGGVALREHPMAIAQLPRWDALTGFLLDGVLGYEAFRDRAVTLDYRTGRLTFPELLPDGETTAITWLRYDDRPTPLVTFGDLKVDGFPAVAQLDTMMTKTAIVFETKLPDLAIDNDPRAPAYEYAGEPLRPGRIGSIRLGTTTLAASVHVYAADARAHVPVTEISLIAGIGLFARRALTIDIPNARLIVS